MWRFVVLLGLVACGDGSVRHIADAPATFQDGATGDDGGAAAEPVSVTITNDSGGEAGITAVFVNLDGTPAATWLTDATGTASQRMMAGGSVTIAMPVAGSTLYNLYTWAGVKPGDHLRYFDSGAAASVGFTLVTPAVAAATSYSVWVVCADQWIFGGSLVVPDGSNDLAFPTGAVTGSSGCATANLVVGAFAGTTLLATLDHPALAFAANQTVDLSSSDHYIAAVAATSSYANVGAPTVFSEFVLTSPTLDFSINTASAVTAGSASVGFPQPASTALTPAMDSWFDVGHNEFDIVDWGIPNGDYALDFANQLLPAVSALSFDLATAEVTWTAGSGVSPDLAQVTVQLAGDPLVQAWTIAAPYAPGTLALPQLAGYQLPSTDTASVGGLTLGKFPGGYDAVRDNAMGNSDYWFTGDGTSGRALLLFYNSSIESSIARQTPSRLAMLPLDARVGVRRGDRLRVRR